VLSQQALEKGASEFPPSDHFAELGQSIVSSLRERLPEYVQHLLDTGRIGVGIVSAPEPRIYVADFEDRSWAIFIHEDLPTLMYRLTRAIVSSLNFSVRGEINNAGIEQQRLVQIVADILWWYRETGLIFGPEYEAGPIQVQTAGAICFEAECFLLAHEISHIILYPARGEIQPEELFERLLWGLPKFGPSEADAWDEEFLADGYAFQVIMGLLTDKVEQIGARNQLRYAGVECMLILTKTLQELGFPVSTSHPPAARRLHEIREHAKVYIEGEELFNALRMFSGIFENIADRVVSILTDPHVSQDQYDDEGERLLIKVETALHRYSDGTTPRYMEFYMEMNSILGIGYHFRLIPMLMRYVDELRPRNAEELIALEFRSSMGYELSSEQRNELRQFSAFKLITGYFRRQANPMGFHMCRYLEGN
jgi:hypothetical protein